MNGFKVGGEIDIYIAKVSGWSQNKVTNIRLVSKKGLKNEWHDLSCQEEEEEIHLCFYDIFLPYNENIFL